MEQQPGQQKRCKVSDLEQGQFVSRRQYLKITGKNGNRVNFVTESGLDFNATNDIVEEAMFSANQFDRTEKVSQTELAEKLMNSNGDIFTVNFNKQPTDESVTTKLSEATVADLGTAATRKALAKRLRDGEERTLIGHLVATEPVMGRSKVVDLEQQFDKPNTYAMRLVDHRSINWLILANVKYTHK